VTGLVVVKPAITDYAITPGDIGQTAYGELGARFQTLVIAFIGWKQWKPARLRI
jgi:hypothetical protein